MSVSSTSVALDACPGCNTENVPLREVYGVPVCEKCAQKCFSEKVRAKIQEAFHRMQDRKKRELWSRRVELVKNGVKAVHKKDYNSALRYFKEYLGILETHYRVPTNGLTPTLFNSKKEAGDILLLSGIYWDMAKIYDMVAGKTPELQQCLNKYVEFSIGRPHHVMSSETVRKYIKTDKCKNKAIFESAHLTLRSTMKKCFIASAVYGPDSFEVSVLQKYRDQKLSKYYLGKTFIKFYYFISPYLLKVMIRSEYLTGLARKKLDKIVRKISE